MASKKVISLAWDLGSNKMDNSYLESLISKEEYKLFGMKTTVCWLQLQNGFEIIGSSACNDFTNFNEYVGQRLAKEDAMKKVEAYEAYRVNDLASRATC